MEEFLTPAGIVLTVGNLLYLTSYVLKDILWLRMLSVVATFTLIAYYLLIATYMPIIWAVLTILINGVQIYMLFLERRPVQFTAEEGELYSLAFRSLTPREFKKLLDLGVWEDFEAGTEIVGEGKQVENLMVVVSGKAAIQRDSKSLAELDRGKFIGEMGFLTGQKTSAAAVAGENTRIFCWPIDKLKVFLQNQSELRLALQMVISNDLVHKLRVKS